MARTDSNNNRNKHDKKTRKPLKYLGLLVLAGFMAVVAMVTYTAFKVGSISQDSLYANIEQSSILYDVNGEEVDSLHYTEDRTIISVDEMPDNLKNAFIAVEDKTFYKHHGFNFRRMVGAVLAKLTGRASSISGTSTITQQLARNAYLSEIKSQRSIRRKLSEMYIAWRLERKLSKDQILEAYLNTIYLGYGNYGVNAAARTYFSKEVSELDLAECAALAALPQAPDAYALITSESDDQDMRIRNIRYYSMDSVGEDNEDEYEENTADAFYANDISKERRDLVLSLMADQGYISTSDASDAEVDIIDILRPSFERTESAYTYFSDYVAGVVIKDLMEKYNMSEEDANRMVYTGGLKIKTTINSDIQNAIYKEFQNDANFPQTADESKAQAAMVVTEIGTGKISGMVGGRDAEGSRLFNRAVSPRQPGSSIKPLAVYGSALQKSFEYASKKQKFPLVDYGFDNQGTKYWGDYITASSGVIDEPLKINGEEWPQNFSRTYSGNNSFRTALQQSINTCAVKIVWQVGLDYSMEMLEKFGLTTLVTDENEATNDINPASLALGAMTYGVTPLEMSLAYAAFPGGGVVNSPICYTEVEDSNGKVLLRSESTETKVLDSGVAWIMTDLLKSVVSKGIAGNAAISGVEVGGKTGTTNDTYDIWFDGFTPEYSAALWIGTDLNVEMYSTSSTAAALWSRIMRQIPGVTDSKYEEMPGNVVKQNGEYYTLGTEKNAGNFYSKSDKKSKSNDDSSDEEAAKAAEEAKRIEELKKKALENAKKKAAEEKNNSSGSEAKPSNNSDNSGTNTKTPTDTNNDNESQNGDDANKPSGNETDGNSDNSGNSDTKNPSDGENSQNQTGNEKKQ